MNGKRWPPVDASISTDTNVRKRFPSGVMTSSTVVTADGLALITHHQPLLILYADGPESSAFPCGCIPDFFLAGEGDFCYSAVHKLISRAIQVETNASGDSVAETEEATGTLRHESSTNVQMMIWNAEGATSDDPILTRFDFNKEKPTKEEERRENSAYVVKPLRWPDSSSSQFR